MNSERTAYPAGWGWEEKLPVPGSMPVVLRVEAFKLARLVLVLCWAGWEDGENLDSCMQVQPYPAHSLAADPLGELGGKIAAWWRELVEKNLVCTDCKGRVGDHSETCPRRAC